MLCKCEDQSLTRLVMCACNPSMELRWYTWRREASWGVLAHQPAWPKMTVPRFRLEPPGLKEIRRRGIEGGTSGLHMHLWVPAPVCTGYTHSAHHAKAMSSLLSLCIYFTLKIHCLNLAWLCMPLIPKQADLLSSSQSGLPVRPYLQIRVKTIKSDVHLALQMDSSQMYNAGKSRFIVIGKWILFLMPKSTIGQSHRFLRCSEVHERWHKLS